MAFDSPPLLGRRVLVWGVTGSGKTTLSRRLGALLDLRVIELDALNWRANWTEAPLAEFRAAVEAATTASDGWVCEGNYRGKLDDLVLARADSLVWLNLPWRVTFWRLLKRTLDRAIRREELWAGNHESLRVQFFSRQSLLLWSITHHRPAGRRAREALTAVTHARVYELHSAREVDAFVAAVAQEQHV